MSVHAVFSFSLDFRVDIIISLLSTDEDSSDRTCGYPVKENQRDHVRQVCRNPHCPLVGTVTGNLGLIYMCTCGGDVKYYRGREPWVAFFLLL